jgi:branched-chain amino acid transport system ATP-binding protein
MAHLRVEGLNGYYGHSQVLWNLSFKAEEEEVIAMVGSNGAGKTTLLKALSGLLSARSGTIEFGGQRIDRLPPHRIVGLGLSQIPEGGGIFPFMTVLENLKMGAFLPSNWKKISENLEFVFQLFPDLRERKHQMAGTLSGGERQMLGIGKGLMASPKLLMMDEPSWGLAPKLVLRVFDTIHEIKRRKVTILLVEQNVYHALRMASRAYVLENGRIGLEGASEALMGNELVQRSYLGA